MSTKPVLYYFDLPGRGEAIRLAFTIGHVDFEDFRVPFNEWVTKYKPNTPAGQLPVLELGHIKYCESNAILMYAAKRAGLVPENPEHLLAMWQAINGLEKVYTLTAPLKTTKPEDKDRVRKEIGEKILEFFESHTKLIGRTQHEKGFIAGDKLSAAELAVYACVKQLRHPFVGFPSDFADNVPGIKKILNLVESVPEVKTYYKL